MYINFFCFVLSNNKRFPFACVLCVIIVCFVFFKLFIVVIDVFFRQMRLIYINKENKFVLSRHEKQFLDIMPNERHRIDLLR
jgi:hypothetical protein